MAQKVAHLCNQYREESDQDEISPLAREDVVFSDTYCETALSLRKYGRALKAWASQIFTMSFSLATLERSSKMRM